MNRAFIDGQNLFQSTTHAASSWQIDPNKFREYLLRKYNITEAYYFMGFELEDQQHLYDNIRSAGFTMLFRVHNQKMVSPKKGNVDTDIVFEIMRQLYKDENPGTFFIVSGDGDYYRLVDFLIQEDKFGRVLFPAKENASSLYRKLPTRFFDRLDNPDIISKIALK